MKRLLYITLTLIDLAICWKPYSDPLVIPTPISNANGTTAITIELLIEWRLSMASQDKLTHITMIDYFPNEQKWYRRSSDQLTACDDRSLLSNNDDLLNNLVQLHGLHQRIITVNGQSPAKPIVVPLGAEVLLRVTNKLLTESISIHIHGLDKRGLWYTDGVPYLQQCPIVVNSKYTYRFIADTPGTHWLHGHMMTDRGEGLLGAFVVTDTDRSAVIDMNGNRIVPTREYVAMLQDWTLPTASDSLYQSRWQSKKWLYGHDNVSECFSAPRSYDGTMIGGAMPLSALLINDKGWYDQQMILSEPWKLPLETFQIRLNEKILLRLINGGVAQQFIFSIEDHSLIVVAADGSSIKPITVDMLAIFPGERYDVLVEGKSHTNRTTYYIILETLEYYTNDFLHRKPFYGLGKMQYDEQLNETGESPADFKHQKCTATSVCTILNCPFATFPPDIFYKCVNVAELRSLNVAANDADILSDRQESNSAFEEHFINMHHGSYVNGWRFISPSGMPYYHNSDENAVTQWCDASKCPSTDVSPFDPGCQCFFHLNITYGNIVQLTFYNMGEAKSLPGCTHAFHIHGTHFYLMKMGFGSYNSSSGMLMTNNADLPCGNGTICNNLQWTNTSWSHGRVPAMNTIDPSFRDTVIIPAGGYVVLRFRATNPGWYYGHCHIMMHQLDGMAFAMRIGTHAEMPAPPDNFPYGCELFEPPPLNMTEISTTSSMLTTTISTKSSAATIHRIYVSILCISSSLFCPQIVNVPSTVVNVQ